MARPKKQKVEEPDAAPKARKRKAKDEAEKAKKQGKKAKAVEVEAQIKQEPEKVIESTSGIVDDLTGCIVNNPMLIAQLKALGFKSKNPEGMTFKEAMICSQIANAVRGDLKSYQEVMKYSKASKTPLEQFVDGIGFEAMDILTGE